MQISMHSNLIYSAFDPRFNVVSLPYLFDSVEDADAKLDGEAGQKMDEILSSYGRTAWVWRRMVSVSSLTACTRFIPWKI